MTHAESPTWRIPPRWVLLVAVLSIVAAEVGGGSMARFKATISLGSRSFRTKFSWASPRAA